MASLTDILDSKRVKFLFLLHKIALSVFIHYHFEVKNNNQPTQYFIDVFDKSSCPVSTQPNENYQHFYRVSTRNYYKI
jgi:hypothetical protein